MNNPVVVVLGAIVLFLVLILLLKVLGVIGVALPLLAS